MAILYAVDGYVADGYVQSGIHIDWGNRIIYVPRSEMLVIQSLPVEIRTLDLDVFRRALKALEAGPDGMTFPDTHRHNTIVELGGVTYARTIEIINDYTITFEDGQYAVNLVGANSNVGDVVNVNQVSVRSANSAGLTYSKEIEDQSFGDGRIWIDTEYGTDGSQFPRGTTGDPTSSYEFAEEIILQRRFRHRFWLNGVQTLIDHDDHDHADWLGSSPVNATLVLAGVNTHGYIIRRIGVTGVGNGNFSIQDGIAQNITNFEGDCSNSGLGGTLTLPTGPMTELVTFHKCFSIETLPVVPIIDCNDASNVRIQFRGYNGEVQISNCTSPDNNIAIDLGSGHVTIDATCTDGVIVIRGDGYVTNNAGPNVVVVTKGLNPSDEMLTTKKFIALK